ncbi:MAG: DUF2975 domain-containing protein [Bacteroidota bacterium]
MKPNLFRSISDSLAESFPLLPRIRRSFIGLLMFCFLFFAIGIGETNGITVPVQPMPDTHFNGQPVTAYASGSITLAGRFKIPSPGIVERILLPNLTTDLDMITLLFLAVASIIIILVVPKLQQQHLFRKDISNYIRLLGYLVALHGLLTLYRNLIYAPTRIEALTNNEFTSFHSSFPILIYAELYFSMVILALAGLYQRGIKLQQEQDLTV